jgi:hypothetical protein
VRLPGRTPANMAAAITVATTKLLAPGDSRPGPHDGNHHGNPTYYAEADDGTQWAGTYAVSLPFNAFSGWCWDLGIDPGADVGMRLQHWAGAGWPYVGTLPLTG